MRDESESVEIDARFFAPRQPATGSDLRLPSWTYVLAIPRRAIRVCGERPSLFDRNRSGPLFTSDKLYTIAKGDERVQRLLCRGDALSVVFSDENPPLRVTVKGSLRLGCCCAGTQCLARSLQQTVRRWPSFH